MGYYNNRYTKTEIVKSQATDIQQIIARLDGIGSLSQFDRNVVEDLKSYYANKGYISENQYNLLVKINDRYNDEKLQQINSWRESFTNEMREKLKIVCEYYTETGYFSNIVREWEKDKENYVPTPDQYQKITENAYAKKLIESRVAPAEFNLGDLVSLRTNANSNKIHSKTYVSASSISGMPLFVVDNNVILSGEIHRYYRVFPTANPQQQMVIREKDLKKYKVK